MMRKQEPPNCIKLGLTEGCNLRCTFCGLQSIREKPGSFKFMTLETATTVFEKLGNAGWNSRVEIGLFGEETANPDFIEIISILRKNLPRNYIILMSNGLGFLKDPGKLLADCLTAGVDTICLDQYEGINIVPKIKERLVSHENFKEAVDEGYIKVYDYPKQRDGNPHQRVKGVKRIVFTADPSVSTTGTHSYLHNYGALGAPPTEAGQGRRCAKPFRELAIRYDGQVPMCCMDWRGEIKLGDLKVEPLDNIWQGALLNAIRKKLYHGERDSGPCEGCGARSYRAGLLPDRMGKESLPKANSKDKELIATATKAPTMTPGIKLPWEKELAARRQVK